MLLLGIDLGTSSVKVSVVDAGSYHTLASVQYPEEEAEIISLRPGWAEQDPARWWSFVEQAILTCHASGLYDPENIIAIGVAYQMHGLVLIDRDQKVLRNAIIWCDSRAVEIGNTAYREIGESTCLERLLNSPGNFTASKLAWVKKNEPELYAKVDKVLLPGDFIAMKFTGECTTTPSALSEGILWDFSTESISKEVLTYFDFDASLFPNVQPVFSAHGYLQKEVASKLSLKTGIPVSYKAGDQLNNAVALNLFQPGQVAATAGTSGVIYGVSSEVKPDAASRINSFVHVNHAPDEKRIGVLLCINGAGIFNRWIKNMFGAGQSYEALNRMAGKSEIGAGGIIAIPFGNGAERMLHNKIVGAGLHHLDLNVNTQGHIVRAAQQGIAFAFRYGLDILRENGIQPEIIRAGNTNMFLSDIFAGSFVGVTGVPVELCESDGSVGAAIGAGMGAGIFTEKDAGSKRKIIKILSPSNQNRYEELYQRWKEKLNEQLNYLNEWASD
jgi:xylulokinase